jgi:hypothetical protein
MPRIEATPDGIEFEFGYEDGTRGHFSCPTEFQTSFLAAFSATTRKRLPHTGSANRPQYLLSAETGMGRVCLQLRLGSDEEFQLLLGAGLAEEMGKIGVHEGWCYHHVQAIILSIDQYAEAATGNRQFFWNKPHSIGK